MGKTEGLFQKIRSEYGFAVVKADVVKNNPPSSVVLALTTKEGFTFALKSLFLSVERQRFITMTEQLLSEKGVPLAKPVRTLAGKLMMIYKGFPYVLYEWLEGKSGRLAHEQDLLAAVKVMARFHRASIGLRYPADIPIYEHPHWHQEYTERMKTMETFLNENKDSDNAKKRLICRSIPAFQKAGKRAIKQLRKSAYEQYRARGAAFKTLVHGDLHHKNILYDGDIGFLIDFEDVRYDLPSKDLLRLYSMYSKKVPFQGDTFRNMLAAYLKEHRLDWDITHLVLTDMLFPHIFERMIRKKKYAGMDVKQLAEWMEREEKKADYIYRQFIKGGTSG